MASVLQKLVGQIAASDIHQLVQDGYPESYELEFKKTLPEKHGKQASWIKGGNEIEDHARNEILSEVIGFANAQGGFVIVGVDETAEKPPRAKSIEAIPRIGELARRIEDQARSCIDMPLPRLETRPIETNSEGGGVLLLYTGPSRVAPHRLATTGHCYLRRGTSTIKMNMREIQDMTLNMARGFAGIAAAFQERSYKFREWANGNIGRHSMLGKNFRIAGCPCADGPDEGVSRSFD